jgi:hypothetical protein
MSSNPKIIEPQAPSRGSQPTAKTVCKDGAQFSDDAGSAFGSPTNDNSTDVEVPSNFESIAFGWRQRLRRLMESKRTLATLLSLILHTVVLIVLALISYSNRLGLTAGSDAVFQFSAEESREVRLSQADVQLAGDVEPAPPEPIPMLETNAHKASTARATQMSEVLKLEPTEPTNRTESQLLEKLHGLNQQNLNATFSNTGVDGRKTENRKKVALERGGTLASEQAVEAALEWLARHQTPGGAWSLLHDRGDCKGRCANPGCRDRFDPAATGLSLLAFLGAGYTHREGKYQQNVERGLYYLRQVVEETPQGSSFLHQSERGMYNHGIAAFALCEAYQLTGDPDLKRVCQEAVRFIATAQGYHGGWGYLPKQPGDLTISGWQLMALKSASAAGLDVPPATILRARNFLESQRAKDGVNYFYREEGEKSINCTAIGILFRMFLGDRTDPAIINGLIRLTKHNDYGNDIYFRYYATLTLFHAGGTLWEEWNKVCREHLIMTQVQDGHEAGSWYFDNPFGKEGGRLYTTAMAAMTLEVYYRYSPLYQQTDQPFEL